MKEGIKGKVKGKVTKEKQEMVKRKDKLKFGFLEAKQDRRIFAMLFIEFAISVAIALSIYFYLDPEVNLIQFKVFEGMPDYLVFILKLVSFVFLMALLAVIFHKTKEFREERKTKTQSQP